MRKGDLPQNSLKIIMNASLPDKVGDTGDVWSGGGEG